MFTKLKHRLLGLTNEKAPDVAYDMWASDYDAQPDNLMLALDEIVFKELLSNIDIKDKVVADIGCGTGRHWNKLYAKKPSRVIGFDVSTEMLKVLKEKFITAETHHLTSNQLTELESSSCDIVISTLALAHIRDIENAFAEWCKVLKPDGQIIITDYHPDALSKGGDRTFKHKGKLVAIKNYIHPILKIQDILAKFNLKLDRLIEKEIDEDVKSYYQAQNAMKVFEHFKGASILYGAHITRRNAAE